MGITMKHQNYVDIMRSSQKRGFVVYPLLFCINIFHTFVCLSLLYYIVDETCLNTSYSPAELEPRRRHLQRLQRDFLAAPV